MPSKSAEQAAIEKVKQTGQASRANMTSRFVGLIVVPGKQISKLEVEERRTDFPTQPLTVRTKT
jgi:hypothetical protein